MALDLQKPDDVKPAQPDVPKPDPSTLLKQLIDTADRVFNRNALPNEHFGTLALAIASERGMTSSYIGDEAMMLVTATRNCAYGGTSQKKDWAMIGGALLPMVRDALGRLIEDRRAASVRSDPEAQPKYGRRD